MAGHFDEIMIVNPIGDRGGKYMRFYRIQSPRAVYFAEAPEQMGAVYEAPEMMGYYSETPETVGYVYETPESLGYCSPREVGAIADPPPGFVEGYGYYAEAPAMGYVYETPDTVGYYAEAPEFAEAPQDMGYYAEAPEFAEVPHDMGYVAESPDMMRYGESAADMGYFADASPVEGYVREQDYNPRVVPVENVGEVEGYYRPRSINPSVDSFRPADDSPRPSSGWFRSPL